MKIIKLILVFLLLAIVPVAARFHTGAGIVTFTHVPIGGAGATIGISGVQSANLLIAKTDQFNCYLSINGSQWTPLLKTNNTPAGRAAINASGVPIGNGCDEGVADPGNTQNIWVGANGRVFLSTDQGATFGDTCYTPLSYGEGLSPGQTPGIKNFAHQIAVDPNNSNIVYMSTPQSGLVATYNKGVNCSTLAAVGIGGAVVGSAGKGGHVIAFDTSAGTNTNLSSPPCPGTQTICTKNVYVSTYGTGVYKSVDGGVNWTLTASTPTTHVAMKADNIGNVYFLDNAKSNGLGALWKYNGSTWTADTTPQLNGAGALGVGVAIDKNSCTLNSNCHVVAMLGGGPGAAGTAFTVNGGSNWTVAQTITTVSTGDVTWLAPFINAGFGHYSAGAAFDNSGNVYTGGEGVFKIVPPSSGTAVTYTAQTRGIEESLSSSVITSASTSGKVALGTWDVNCFVNIAMPYTSFPTTANRGCYSTNGTGLQRNYNMDWASTDPSFLVALTDNQQGYGGGTYTNFSGTSTDGGVNWLALSGPPTVAAGGYKGGCIAAASSTNFMWLPTDGSGGAVFPLYTTNGGTNWTSITVSGITASGWPYQYYNNSKSCAADRVPGTNPNTFYLYNWNDGVTGNDAIVKCTSGGASCAIQSVPLMDANRQVLHVIKTVPGYAGHLFLSSAGNAPIDSTTGALKYYTDGGVTPNVVANMKGVLAFGFGAAFPNHSYPAIVVVGIYNGTFGIWQSIDWDGAKTWQPIGTYPMNLGVTIKDIDGDKVIPNVFYYTTDSGLFCSAPSTAYCNGGT